MKGLLNEDTITLANGYDAVCVFVNDKVDKPLIDTLCQMGIKSNPSKIGGAITMWT